MDAILAIFRVAIIATIIVVTGIFSSVFEGMCSLGLGEVLDRPNSCFRIFSLKIFRGLRTHVFVKYFAVLWLCCACGRPLINWNSIWTHWQGLKLSSVFEGMGSLGLVEVLDTPNSCFRISIKNISRSSDTCFRKIFRGGRTMLRLRRTAYKLELYGHRDSN